VAFSSSSVAKGSCPKNKGVLLFVGISEKLNKDPVCRSKRFGTQGSLKGLDVGFLLH
jgi:hypothetical protein